MVKDGNGIKRKHHNEQEESSTHESVNTKAGDPQHCGRYGKQTVIHKHVYAVGLGHGGYGWECMHHFQHGLRTPVKAIQAKGVCGMKVVQQEMVDGGEDLCKASKKERDGEEQRVRRGAGGEFRDGN